MKTTLDINDTLLTSAKELAARQRTTLTRLIEEGLQLRLRAVRAPRRTKSAAPAFPVHAGQGGLVRGLDPLSNRAMLDAIDAIDDTPRRSK